MIGNTPVALRCRLGCRGFQDLSGGANSRKSGENGDARPRFLKKHDEPVVSSCRKVALTPPGHLESTNQFKI